VLSRTAGEKLSEDEVDEMIREAVRGFFDSVCLASLLRRTPTGMAKSVSLAFIDGNALSPAKDYEEFVRSARTPSVCCQFDIAASMMLAK
jgi:hypothetical protein